MSGKSRSGMSHADRRQLWLDRLNRFADSGMTVEDFCKSEQVSVPSYYYWKQKLAPMIAKNSSGSSSLKRKSNPAFTQLVINHAQSQATVSLPGGIAIELGTQLELALAIVDRLVQHACPAATVDNESPRC
jgi:hypothetical protein